jgi:hypothetical protein
MLARTRNCDYRRAALTLKDEVLFRLFDYIVSKYVINLPPDQAISNDFLEAYFEVLRDMSVNRRAIMVLPSFWCGRGCKVCSSRTTEYGTFYSVTLSR